MIRILYYNKPTHPIYIIAMRAFCLHVGTRTMHRVRGDGGGMAADLTNTRATGRMRRPMPRL